MRYKIILCLLLSIVLVNMTVYSQDSLLNNNHIPQFDLPDTNFSNSGSLKLSWSVADSVLEDTIIYFELQQADNPEFNDNIIRYNGSDLASYISGLDNGQYYYRVRSIIDNQSSIWSKSILVSVEHHSLKLAFLLFGLGALVFLATVFVVVKGSREEAI